MTVNGNRSVGDSSALQVNESNSLVDESDSLLSVFVSGSLNDTDGESLGMLDERDRLDNCGSGSSTIVWDCVKHNGETLTAGRWTTEKRLEYARASERLHTGTNEEETEEFALIHSGHHVVPHEPNPIVKLEPTTAEGGTR